VIRWAGSTMIEVVGIVTAQVVEALHLRMSAERNAHQIYLLLYEVQITATSLSLVEAAVRGTAGSGLPAPVKFLVRAPRINWARQHCSLMSEHGISCSADRLPESATMFERRVRVLY
jgi:hypothetical protein